MSLSTYTDDKGERGGGELWASSGSRESVIVKGVAQQRKLAMQTWCHIWVDFAVGSYPGSEFASFCPQ